MFRVCISYTGQYMKYVGTAAVYLVFAPNLLVLTDIRPFNIEGSTHDHTLTTYSISENRC